MSTTLRDGLVSMSANLGAGTTDKARSVSYETTPLQTHQIASAFRSSWVCKKIVKIPAKDATRKWRQWTGSRADEIGEAEKAWKIQSKVYEAKWKSRLFGGAAILIGTGESLEEPLNMEAVGLGDLKYLTVLSRNELSAKTIERDPREMRYGLPQMYYVDLANGGTALVHPSRVSEFFGEELPNQYDSVSADQFGWGDSVLQSVFDECQNLDSAMANLASLVFEAKTDVVKVPDLMNQIQNPHYEQAIIQRMVLARQLKGNNGTLLLDATEDYVQRTYNFSGLPDVVDRFMQVASGAADIPVTRLLNQSPGGLNSTGESDLTNYYDNVLSIQTNEIQPAISALDEVLVRSTIGEYDTDLGFEWRKLKQMTEEQESEIRSRDADTVSKLYAAGVDEEMVDEIAMRLFQANGLVKEEDV